MAIQRGRVLRTHGVRSGRRASYATVQTERGPEVRVELHGLDSALIFGDLLEYRDDRDGTLRATGVVRSARTR